MTEEFEMPAYIPKILYTLMLLAGVILYVSWLTLYGLDKWNDVGLYSVTVILIGFGLVGKLLYGHIEQVRRDNID